MYAAPKLITLGDVATYTRGDCGFGLEDWDKTGGTFGDPVCSEYCTCNILTFTCYCTITCSRPCE